VAGEGAKRRTAQHVPAGRDRFHGQREVFGSRVIDTKVSTWDTNGGLSVAEITDFCKGGPAQEQGSRRGWGEQQPLTTATRTNLRETRLAEVRILGILGSSHSPGPTPMSFLDSRFCPGVLS